jgi:GT2 family glycosyltransferase
MAHSISVILTHYNRPDFLREALESICGQTLKPSEILIVDDNSTPDNFERLQEFAQLATIIKTPRNLGAPGARNFGASVASSEWLCFLDDDDVYVPDKLERQARYLAAHPGAVALGGALTMVKPDGTREHWGGTYTGRLSVADALNYTASLPPALMIRRDIFLKLGGFDPLFMAMEDYEFGVRIAESGNEFHFLGEALFTYRRGGRKQLSLEFGKMLRGELKAQWKHRRLLRREFGPFATVRFSARSLRRAGLRIGGVKGRSTWALGCGLDAIFGRYSQPFD